MAITDLTSPVAEKMADGEKYPSFCSTYNPDLDVQIWAVCIIKNVFKKIHVKYVKLEASRNYISRILLEVVFSLLWWW